MQLHVELDIINELCTLHRFLVEFLSRMNNVFANEKKIRFLLLQASYYGILHAQFQKDALIQEKDFFTFITLLHCSHY